MSATLRDFELRPSLQLVPAVTQLPRPRSARPPLWIDGEPRPHEVLQAFERSGGLWTGDEVASMLRRRNAQPLSLLARWIVDSLVVSCAWRGDYLLPMFQFDVAAATLRPPVFEVLEALDGTLKDLGLVSWFAAPNACLAGAAPVDVIGRDPRAVLEAARAERRTARA